MAGIATSLDMQFLEKHKNEGRLARKKGSKKLYLDFFYHGTRIERSTGLEDTPKNRTKAETILNRILEMKKEGTLEFARLFPGASEEEKAFHTFLEKGEYAPTPKALTFGAYVKKWYSSIWINYEENTQKDFKSAIDFRLLPYFKDLTFFQITGVTLQKFVATLVHKDGPKMGKKLARSSMINNLQIFKTIWDDAVVEHRWILPDPQKGLRAKLPAKVKKKVAVFRFNEWEALLDAIDPYYRPVTELMVLTGLMASEIAGLKPQHVQNGMLYVEKSIVRGKEKDTLKNTYREREIPITGAIRDILGQAQQTVTSDYLFTMSDGKNFSAERYQKLVWVKAMKEANITYRKPYSTRHTFAAWALALRTDPNRLVDLMGHASKQMIYEVYGKYTEGLEQDRLAILRYFGRDFRNTGKRIAPAACETSCESRGFRPATT